MLVTFSVLSNYKVVKYSSVNNIEYLIGVLAAFVVFIYVVQNNLNLIMNSDLCLKNTFFKESSKKITHNRSVKIITHLIFKTTVK